MERTYYEILGVSQSADKKEIKKAFKAKAKQHHPDKNRGDSEAEEVFKEINEAYQVLSDESKRATYDRFGKEALDGGGGGSRSGFGSFEDIFEDFFGGGGSSQKSRNSGEKFSEDLEIVINLSFRDAIFGVKKDMSFEYKTACSPCSGTGADGGRLVHCHQCEGHGKIHIRQGFMSIAQTCPVCHGNGTMPSKSCGSCRGNGFNVVSEKVSFSIPEGVDDGNRMRVGGKGNVLASGSRGDLYLQMNVEKDKDFIRDGSDIYMEIPIFFTNILLSKSMTIPSIRGELELSLHPKIKDKEHIVFRNKGVKDVNGSQIGRFIVQTKIIYPTSINKNQEELLSNLHDSFYQSMDNENVFDKVFNKVKSWIQ